MKKIRPKAQIGIVWQGLHMESTSPLYVHMKAVAAAINQCTDVVFNFFLTGNFEYRVPFGKNIEHDGGLRAMHANDFIGLNYYSHVLLGATGDAYRPHEVATRMPFAIYAEGLYHAIRHVSQLRLPIYITENGIPDERNEHKDLWIKRYMYAIQQALADGFDVRGLFYWSSMDNYEWNYGYTIRWGLSDRNREIYPGVARFIKHAHAQKS